MEAAPEYQSQADFARHMGVSRAAVSQWKKKDILRADAFSQPGKTGKVIVAVAIEQVRRNRDIGQALGNGIETRTSSEGAGDPAPVPAAAQNTPVEQTPDLLRNEPEQSPGDQAASTPLPKTNTVEDLLKQAKLEEQLRRNRIQASEEALRQSLLVSAEDTRAQMMRVAGLMLQIFEGALPDFAAVIASQFKVPQRDIVHLLKSEFRNIRQVATQKERAQSVVVEKDVMASLELET